MLDTCFMHMVYGNEHVYGFVELCTYSVIKYKHILMLHGERRKLHACPKYGTEYLYLYIQV